jgi:hypothetical protein
MSWFRFDLDSEYYDRTFWDNALSAAIVAPISEVRTAPWLNWRKDIKNQYRWHTFCAKLNENAWSGSKFVWGDTHTHTLTLTHTHTICCGLQFKHSGCKSNHIANKFLVHAQVVLCFLCFVLCVLCFCIVLCIVSPHAHTCLLSICVQVYWTLPPAGN